MGFRTLEISHAAEIHIKEGQLEITTEEGVVVIPIEDLNQIMVHGANIRLSTMDLSILSQNKVALMTLDEKYLPTAIVLPFEGHARQSKLMHSQVNATDEKYLDLWVQIIKQKISNQSRSLSIMGLEGAEKIAEYVATGFHPTFGIHHDSQLNAFNLADDLIEPYRAIVDLVAHENISSNVQLSKAGRGELAHVLHNACIVDGIKVNVMSAIDMMVESLKRIILENTSEKLKLPVIVPIEYMEGITE